MDQIGDKHTDDEDGAYVGSIRMDVFENSFDISKTDSLTFTVANTVDANTKSINDVTVTGTGVSTNLWRA